MNPLVGFLPNLGFSEVMVLMVIGVILFGRKLPEVGKYLGKGIVEFKKGLKGLEDEVDTSAALAPRPEAPSLEAPRPPQRVVTTAPKFEDSPNSITTPPKA